MAEPVNSAVLKRTPLYDFHVRLGARMVGFAGYDIPVQFPSGIIKEHLHTRAAAGLFDVSHMGQIALYPRSGHVEDAARALETLVPSDILGLAKGRQRYTMFTNSAGGVLDDLMVSNQGDHLMLVVNAARKMADEKHLLQHISASCLVKPLTDRALVALQGPKAETALAALVPEVRTMAFMDTRVVTLLGEVCLVSRSGYTGEDGFEIGVPARIAMAFCESLLRDPAIAPIGLGARDSLRLEAGLCLYGSDLDETTTPIEAALEWTIPKVRRGAGERAGGFAGSAAIFEQIAIGTARRRVGLRPEGHAPARRGVALFLAESDPTAVGVVTSGGFGVSLNAPIAMGYVPQEAARLGTRLFAEVRGKRLPVIISELPFVPTHYRRF
jgi:glycine cleavage system T protein (aminomethyltransferase)